MGDKLREALVRLGVSDEELTPPMTLGERMIIAELRRISRQVFLATMVVFFAAMAIFLAVIT